MTPCMSKNANKEVCKMSKYTKQEKSEIICRFQSGEKISTLSKELCISRGTIYSWIKYEKQRNQRSVNLHDYNLLKQKCERLTQMVVILKTASCTVNSPQAEKYRVIKELSDKYSVSLLCETFNVPKGSYYNYLLRNKNENTLASQKRAELTPVIDSIFHENNEIYGSGKIHAILKDRGYKVSKQTVAYIMHENDMFLVRSSAKILYLKEQERKKNILNRKFDVNRPNEVWVGDVTYFNFDEKQYYICIILDLFARIVVAYRVSLHNSTQLTTATFKQAYTSREIAGTLMFHSDQGANYTSKTYRKLLHDLGVEQSFSQAGVPYDNSVMESFFKSMKTEELYRTKYHSESEFRKAIDKYITFYNSERPHTFLRYHTPDKVEEEYYQKIKQKSL